MGGGYAVWEREREREGGEPGFHWEKQLSSAELNLT